MEQNINEIVRILVEAKRDYYGSGETKLTDKEFDDLEEQLKNVDPQNSYFKQVGFSNRGSAKIEHREPMLSMGKVKNAEDANKWFKKISLSGVEYCMQPKIDGLSATCKYVNGKLQYVATRGDGFIGQDITHIKDYVTDIKSSITFSSNNVEVRGELYLPKDTSYDTKGKALRNNCVGLINRKENRADLKYVRFVCYQIVGDNSITLESNKIDLLKEDGFNVVEYEVYKSGTDIGQYIKNYLSVKREEWNYETDGIIITVNNNKLHEEIDSRWVVDHHHHYNLAVKPPSEGRETVLRGVSWQVSRQGSIIPVAIFDSIHIGGAKIERATLHNYQNVVKLKLRLGDLLYVERANDVIPYVKSNLSGSDRIESNNLELIPLSCPECGCNIELSGVHIKCLNRECPEIKIQQIIYWVKESDIDGVAEGTLRSLYQQQKIRTIKDLYLLQREDLVDLDGFGDKKIDIFINGINKSKSITPIQLLSRLGIPLVQEKALKKLNIFTIDEFKSFNNIDYIIGQNIISWKKNELNMIFLNELLEVLFLIETKMFKSLGLVCMTGKGPLPRKDIISIISEKGWEFSSSLTKDVKILLCEDVEGSSSKLIKAKKQGTELMLYSDFLTNY
ncbi:MAG: hypothetical protein B6229_00890 [Spirochaetaceae bacterium 4572_7]|nr:MAG: hypothetical protein B6229_00890 [Spirochaetaceae bacterium 4572_7]